jgi:helicase
MTADEVVAFIEDSFGAFQQRQLVSTWKWDESKLYAAVAELARHDLIEQHEDGRYFLAPRRRDQPNAAPAGGRVATRTTLHSSSPSIAILSGTRAPMLCGGALPAVCVCAPE